MGRAATWRVASPATSRQPTGGPPRAHRQMTCACRPPRAWARCRWGSRRPLRRRKHSACSGPAGAASQQARLGRGSTEGRDRSQLLCQRGSRQTGALQSQAMAERRSVVQQPCRGRPGHHGCRGDAGRSTWDPLQAMSAGSWQGAQPSMYQCTRRQRRGGRQSSINAACVGGCVHACLEVVDQGLAGLQVLAVVVIHNVEGSLGVVGRVGGVAPHDLQPARRAQHRRQQRQQRRRQARARRALGQPAAHRSSRHSGRAAR